MVVMAMPSEDGVTRIQSPARRQYCRTIGAGGAGEDSLGLTTRLHVVNEDSHDDRKQRADTVRPLAAIEQWPPSWAIIPICHPFSWNDEQKPSGRGLIVPRYRRPRRDLVVSCMPRRLRGDEQAFVARPCSLEASSACGEQCRLLGGGTCGKAFSRLW
jgi:hypothetical protein